MTKKEYKEKQGKAAVEVLEHLCSVVSDEKISPIQAVFTTECAIVHLRAIIGTPYPNENYKNGTVVYHNLTQQCGIKED